MLLDLTPLTLSHLLLFGSSFILVFGLFAALLRLSPFSLRAHIEHPQVYFGGAMVIGVISLLGYIVLDDVYLRIGLLASAFLTLLIGIIDEHVKLPASRQFVWQIVIATIAVGWGWTIREISNPWESGVISLNSYTIGSLVLPGALLAIIWLVFLMNAVNWLDGIDGLAGGVGVVTFFTLGAVSLLPSVQDSTTLALAAIGAGGVLGFLLWNFPPARVYLGTSGSWFLGLYIGMIAIVGGGKIVTTLLVLALPVIDMLAVIIARLWARQIPWHGDTVRHFHHRLLSAGFQARSIAILGTLLSVGLGIGAITLQTRAKIIAFLIAGCMLTLVIASLIYQQARSRSSV
ncbi:MAG: MraY family glycosyltransferase [Candidatus Andersenbacteria bacterium]